MATELKASMCFHGTPAQVLMMLCNNSYLEAKCADTVASSYEVTQDHEATQICVTRALEADLPDMAKALLSEQLIFTEIQRWDPLGDQQEAKGTLHISIKGAPAHISGTLALHPCPIGTCIDISGDISVAIPIFGTKAEKLIAQEVQSICQHEEKIGNEWLSR